MDAWYQTVKWYHCKNENQLLISEEGKQLSYSVWVNHFMLAWHFLLSSLHWKDDMEDEQLALTNMHLNERLSQPSSLSFLW